MGRICGAQARGRLGNSPDQRWIERRFTTRRQVFGPAQRRSRLLQAKLPFGRSVQKREDSPVLFEPFAKDRLRRERRVERLANSLFARQMPRLLFHRALFFQSRALEFVALLSGPVRLVPQCPRRQALPLQPAAPASA